jgi:hypothetical protein
MKYSKAFKKKDLNYMWGQHTFMNNIRNKNSWDTETFEEYCKRCYMALRFQQLAPLMINEY